MCRCLPSMVQAPTSGRFSGLQPKKEMRWRHEYHKGQSGYRPYHMPSRKDELVIVTSRVADCGLEESFECSSYLVFSCSSSLLVR
jgi:hypothetical protein